MTKLQAVLGCRSSSDVITMRGLAHRVPVMLLLTIMGTEAVQSPTNEDIKQICLNAPLIVRHMLTLLKEVEERSILLAQYLDESQHNDKQQNCAGLTDIAKTISILVKNNTYDWRAIVKDYTNGLTPKQLLSQMSFKVFMARHRLYETYGQAKMAKSLIDATDHARCKELTLPDTRRDVLFIWFRLKEAHFFAQHVRSIDQNINTNGMRSSVGSCLVRIMQSLQPDVLAKDDDDDKDKCFQF